MRWMQLCRYHLAPRGGGVALSMPLPSDGLGERHGGSAPLDRVPGGRAVLDTNSSSYGTRVPHDETWAANSRRIELTHPRAASSTCRRRSWACAPITGSRSDTPQQYTAEVDLD